MVLYLLDFMKKKKNIYLCLFLVTIETKSIKALKGVINNFKTENIELNNFISQNVSKIENFGFFLFVKSVKSHFDLLDNLCVQSQCKELFLIFEKKKYHSKSR